MAAVFGHDQADSYLTDVSTQPLLILDLSEESIMLLCHQRESLPVFLRGLGVGLVCCHQLPDAFFGRGQIAPCPLEIVGEPTVFEPRSFQVFLEVNCKSGMLLACLLELGPELVELSASFL